MFCDSFESSLMSSSLKNHEPIQIPKSAVQQKADMAIYHGNVHDRVAEIHHGNVHDRVAEQEYDLNVMNRRTN